MAQQSPTAKNCSYTKSDGWSSFLRPFKSHVILISSHLPPIPKGHENWLLDVPIFASMYSRKNFNLLWMAQQSPAAKNCSHAKSDGWSSFLGPLKSHVWHYKLVHRETFMASRARSLAWIFFITFSSSTISSLLVVSLDLQIYGRHFNPTQDLKKNQNRFQFLFHAILGISLT